MNLFYLLTLATPAFAAGEFDELEKTLSGYHQKLFVPAGLVLAAIVIVYAGILYSTSQGDPTKVSLAKEFLIGAIIGLVLLLGAGVIVGAIAK